MSRILGVDLGTTNSCMALASGSQPEVVPNSEGERTTPSVVSFNKEGDRLVGALAKRQAVLNPEVTFQSVKRLLGRRYEDPDSRELVAGLPYGVRRGDRGEIRLEGPDGALAPEQVLAVVLAKLRADVEEFLGEAVERAIITVPAHFDDLQRSATRAAARIAGLHAVRLLNEPTSAALAYGLTRKKSGIFAVYDLGGGTFDISVLESDYNSFDFRVLGTAGDTRLGGNDVDARIVARIREGFAEAQGFELDGSPMVEQRLLAAAEDAKKALSSATAAPVSIPFIARGPEGPVHLEIEVLRADLDEIMRPLVERSIGICEGVLDDAGLTPGDVDEVLLVGGQTRSPIVRVAVTELFGREPIRGVEPDEAVALGAALLGRMEEQEAADSVVTDVCPLSLGIRTADGSFSPLIRRNTPIPARTKKTFTTAQDNQLLIQVHVHQGEREQAQDNLSLGTLELVGIRPAPAGVPKIELTFGMGQDGQLEVTARDQGSGRERQVRLEARQGLTDEEVQAMVEAAEAERRARREQARAAEAGPAVDPGRELLGRARRALEDRQNPLEDRFRTRIEMALTALEAAIRGDPDYGVDESMEAIRAVLEQVGR